MPKFTAKYKTDYYNRLGIAPTDDARLIRRQYRLLVRLYHPDVNGSLYAKKRFLAMQEAYQVLAHEKTRQDFDRWLKKRSLSPLQMTVELSPPVLVRRAGKQRVYGLIEIKSRQEKLASHTPLNVVLVLDRSSSMKGRRLYAIQEATHRIIDLLSANDTFGLVTFNDRGKVVLPSGKAENPFVAHSAIDSILATGGTEIAQGLRLGLQEVLKHHHSNVLSHLILLTDGRTYGDEGLALQIAKEAQERGVGITAFGLGSDWSDDFLDKLAQSSNGSAHFMAKPEQAESFFQSQIQRLQHTFARDASLNIKMGAGVTLLQAHEVAPGLRDLAVNQQNKITLGSLPADQSLRLLIQFGATLPKRDVCLLSNLILSAQSVQDLKTYQAERLTLMDINHSASPSVSEEIYEAARRVATLRMQDRTWQSLADGEREESIARLEHLADRFQELGSTNLAAAAMQERNFLEKTGRLSENGRKTIKYGTRMLALPPPKD